MFKLTIQKSAVEPPRAFLDALRDAYSGATSFTQYLALADETYRTAGPDQNYIYLYPGDGFPTAAAKRIEKLMSDAWEGEGVSVDFEWALLDDEFLFEIGREPKSIRLNRLYRNALTGGANSKTDAPLTKLLLLFLLRETLMKDRVSKAQRDRMEHLNAALLQVIK